ncbi:MAG: putative DNA binding domain-containing protein [Candidatus Micrarchaeota archaeon]|nr:putative DNA binding domain-containing protein [Candidatus Micrarchaeota archaeon]
MEKKELEFIIRQGESLTAEFKRSFSPKIDEDIVAFSNSRGGNILLGVQDDKAIAGAELTNDLRAKTLSLARNCKPSIEVSISQVDKLVVISIPEGSEKPYSCATGYFRRLDGATQKMNRDELRLMFAKNEVMPFEERPSQASLKDISGEKVRAFLREAHLPKAPRQSLLTSLKLYSDGRVNNAGAMFFAKNPRNFILQCQMSCIAFKGTEQMDIYDRTDVRDDLLSQFNAGIFFLKKHLNLISTIKGVNRVDEYDIPLDALREAVANAIMHRDYSVRGTDLTIHVFDDRVEITNPSILLAGTDPRTLEGVSIRHNEIIADMFYRMDKAERAGTGIMKMRRIMKSAGLVAPKLVPGPFCRIIFERPEKNVPINVPINVPERLASITKLISENNRISAPELSKLLNVTEKTVKRDLQKLKRDGVLKRIGPTKGGRWEIVKLK